MSATKIVTVFSRFRGRDETQLYYVGHGQTSNRLGLSSSLFKTSLHMEPIVDGQ